MQLKEFQQRALSVVKIYLEYLAQWRKRADDNPELELDFPAKAWEKAGIRRPYSSRKNGIDQPLPNFCLKVPTGGGKTLLAVKTIDLVNMIYRRQKAGLVLWIVPTTQIYRQTIQNLKNRDHPYRQHLDLASGGRTKILEKTDRFSPQDIKENLVIFMLMLPSANRKTKEVLKVFKDSGGFQDFFPLDDDIKGQESFLKLFPNLDTYEKQSGFWGKQIKTSLGNTLRMLSPLVILDEGHKAYSEGAQTTLRSFNPGLIVELSATPPQSNILVDITGKELHREQMIKLDLHIVNKVSPDWKDTLLAGHNQRNVLERKAREYEADTGYNIRPICLIQAERTGAEQRKSRYIHSEDVREHLIKVMGIPADEVAVKTSEKDELKEVDDIGGLMSRECKIRYIITKQALQEGWDCAFAYVLVILTNPSSKNALTQLVGRILRQPFARKTGVKELDESYVFCFQQRANLLLESVRNGFEQEGLGDLRGQIVSDDEQKGERKERIIEIRDKFKKAARRTLLPVFVVREKSGWRSVNYEMDIAARIPWKNVNLEPMQSLSLSTTEIKDEEHVATLSEDAHEVIKQKAVIRLKEGGISVDPVFMTRQLGDTIPNPWQAHELVLSVLEGLRKKNNEDLIINNFVFIIEEMRRYFYNEKDRLAEEIFHDMLKSGELRFLIIGSDLRFTFPEKMAIKPELKTLTRKDGSQLQLNLFEFVPEDEFNETEKAVAWFLEDQKRLFFWYRNRVRYDYSIQGWRPHRIYPDFIMTSKVKEEGSDYTRIYVIETKGLHLKDNEKTAYIRKVFNICTKEAKSISWGELGLKLKDNALKFEVLAEDEWEAKLNELLGKK
jgi:type III restriction enzyme